MSGNSSVMSSTLLLSVYGTMAIRKAEAPTSYGMKPILTEAARLTLCGRVQIEDAELPAGAEGLHPRVEALDRARCALHRDVARIQRLVPMRAAW